MSNIKLKMRVQAFVLKPFPELRDSRDGVVVAVRVNQDVGV